MACGFDVSLLAFHFLFGSDCAKSVQHHRRTEMYACWI